MDYKYVKVGTNTLENRIQDGAHYIFSFYVFFSFCSHCSSNDSNDSNDSKFYSHVTPSDRVLENYNIWTYLQIYSVSNALNKYIKNRNLQSNT